MSPEQINIAIAKACGWIVFTLLAENGEPHGFPPAGFKPKTKCSAYQTNKLAYYLPDYHNDLNAMHEAEKVLMTNPNLMNKYQNYELPKFVSSANSNWLCRASAAQRAEAFLRTLGLWEEKP